MVIIVVPCSVFGFVYFSVYVSSLNMSVKEERISDADGEVYSERTIKGQPMTSEWEDQCSNSLIKVTVCKTEDDTDAVSSRKLLEFEVKREELCEEEQIVDERESSDTYVTIKDEIEIGPTVIQPQYIGSLLHTTDASKAELIQCGGVDVALGTTTPGAASYCCHSTGSRSEVHGGTSHQIKEGKEILKNLSKLLFEKKPFACHICEYKSAKKPNLIRHMNFHTGNKPHSCNICEFKSRHKSNLLRHANMHTGEKPFACNNCEYICSTKSSMAKHMHIHTGVKPFSCIFCEYKCVYKSRLMTHVRTHTGEKPFSCNFCDYKSVDKPSLVKHRYTHTGEKPFSCNICGYKCILKSNLIRHMRSHTGDKPYSCNICEYKCALKSHLVTHMYTHTGEKPFSCNICKYKCVVKSHLVNHMRTHTGEKPFSCNVCKYKCVAKSNMVRHMRSH